MKFRGKKVKKALDNVQWKKVSRQVAKFQSSLKKRGFWWMDKERKGGGGGKEWNWHNIRTAGNISKKKWGCQGELTQPRQRNRKIDLWVVTLHLGEKRRKFKKGTDWEGGRRVFGRLILKEETTANKVEWMRHSRRTTIEGKSDLFLRWSALCETRRREKIPEKKGC